MKNIIFDIETAPDLEKVKAFTKPFSRDDVKLGNLKDPEKIEAKLVAAEADHWSKANDQAALNPHTSTICAVGIHLEDTTPRLIFGKEKDILDEFWSQFNDFNHLPWCYYSGCNDRSTFDPRHIIVRSWVNGIKTPHQIVSERGYLSPAFVDLAQVYLFGASYPAYCSVEMAIKQLGLIGTTNAAGTVQSKEAIEEDTGVTGKNFHEHCQNGPSAAAYAYLTNDLACERAIADTIL